MTSKVMEIPDDDVHTFSMKYLWLLPAVLAVAFFSFTLWSIAVTGQPLGFVAEHTHSIWGAQVGIDLMNALLVGIYFANVLSPQYHFRAWPYVILTLCTGSPGVLALAARVLYARRHSLYTLAPKSTPTKIAMNPPIN
jgi:hypothetical protein